MSALSRRTRRAGSKTRPLAWPVLVCTVVCVLTPRPAFADPAPAGGPPTSPAAGGTTAPDVTIPDIGATPVPSTPLPGPTTHAPATAAPVTGPFAAQILAKFAETEAVGEKLTQAGIDLTAAQSSTKTTYDVWQDALAQAKDLQGKADGAAAKAYKDAAGLGPFSEFATDVHQLGMLAPGLGDGSRGGPGGSETAIQDAARAKQQASIDEQAYRSALAHEQQLETDQTNLTTSHNQLNAELVDLRTRNKGQVDQAEAAQEAIDRGLAPRFKPGSSVAGKVANPKAIAALTFAYAQLGKPYVWATEGPYTYDCSGLMWAAYRSTGYQLPRVANDQFHATQEIPPNQLLPGDMLFFSVTSGTDWTTISHVAMYVGDGLMIEAPRTGERVKVTTVWWSAFFGATRVYPAVPAAPPPPHPPTTTPPITPPSTPPPSSPTPPPSTPATPTDPPSTPPSTDPTDPPSTPPSTDPTNPPTTPPATDPTATPTDPPTTPPATNPTATPTATPTDPPTTPPATNSPAADPTAAPTVTPTEQPTDPPTTTGA